MRKLIPVSNTVVCKKNAGKSKIENDNGILLKCNDVDIYDVIGVSDPKMDTEEYDDFMIGDKIMSTSSGDEIEINSGETVYVFKKEHIMCKIGD